MAAGHPKLKTSPGAEFFLSRFADGEWRGVVRPWLEGCAGSLVRSVVVAPTRGQTQALKQRCMEEGVPLLGVEFLTPGLARRKRGAPEPLARALQLLVLRSHVLDRVAALGPDDRARGVWRSLESDLEAALGEFEALLRAGLRAEHFPAPELREAFGELVAWAGRHGYGLAALDDQADLVRDPPEGTPPVADRLLILAGGPEGWSEFFGHLALARRCHSVCVVAAEPDLSRGDSQDDPWVDAWEKALDVASVPIDDERPPESGASPEGARVIVGESRSDEMELVADHVEELLAGGARSIAVVFPGAGASHARLRSALGERGVAHADLIGAAGTVPVDTRIQARLVDLYERGCRLEELLALWPLLQAHGFTELAQGDARRVCEGLHERTQSHRFEPHVSELEADDDKAKREVGKVARVLMPAWPERLTPAAALGLFESARDRLGLEVPAGWSALVEFAGRVTEEMPARALLGAIRSFIPEKGPLAREPGRSVFARVTLTTLRRAVGVAWSHTIFVSANDVPPPKSLQPSCWLPDESRTRLRGAEGRLPIGLPTSAERKAAERRLRDAVRDDTGRQVAYSAACHDDDDPEIALGPDSTLERVLLAKGLLPDPKGAVGALARLARRRSPAAFGAPVPPGWLDVWSGRRDPSRPFDSYFLGDPGSPVPDSLAAIQIERGAKDPASLWFDAVLGTRRIEWRPLVRSREKTVGILVHRLLSRAVRGERAGGDFFRIKERAAAGDVLAEELARLRAQWPRDRYWDSFHLDVERAAGQLLGQVYTIGRGAYGAAEVKLPSEASLPLAPDLAIGVRGRMDLVLSDAPQWDGAEVQIVDFKTGKGAALTAKAMGGKGVLLQLGVYLAAVRSLGASGSVWMLKPEKPPASLGPGELPEALAKLESIAGHLRSGIYGALTEDRGEHSHGLEWPVACAPIPSEVLRAKFAATFGVAAPEDGGRGGDD
jgi:hypothetical protein